MAVAADGDGSTVTLTTDFTVVGRVAQFGRGIMEDVSRHLVGQAAECIQSKLETPPPSASPAGDAGSTATDAVPAANGSSATPPISMPPTQASQPAALDAVALGKAVAKERLSRLKVRPQTVAIGLAGLLQPSLAAPRFRRARRRRRASTD